MNIKYGKIITYRNVAGIGKLRALGPVTEKHNGQPIIEGRILGEDNRCIRYTEQDVKDGNCLKAFVGLPTMTWCYVSQIENIK